MLKLDKVRFQKENSWDFSLFW